VRILGWATLKRGAEGISTKFTVIDNHPPNGAVTVARRGADATPGPFSCTGKDERGRTISTVSNRPPTSTLLLVRNKKSADNSTGRQE
jgi:hypothetical protein